MMEVCEVHTVMEVCEVHTVMEVCEVHTVMMIWTLVHTVDPPNKGHFGDDLISADLFFVDRLSSLGGSKCIVGIILGL